MPAFSTNAVRPWRQQFAETPKRKATIPPPAATEQPDDGLIRIKGSGAAVINLNHSQSENYSRSVMMETRRTSDVVRIKNPDDPNQRVDVKRPRTINTQSNENTTSQPMRRRPTGAYGAAYETTVYAKQEETETIEILEENVTDVNEDWDPGGSGPAAP